MTVPALTLVRLRAGRPVAAESNTGKAPCPGDLWRVLSASGPATPATPQLVAAVGAMAARTSATWAPGAWIPLS